MQYRDPHDQDYAATARPSARADASELLTPGEVARLFGVDPKTVTRWATAGKLTALRTLGGHRRYRAAEVYALLERTDAAATRPSGRGVSDWDL